MCLNLLAIDWAMHVFGALAKAQVPKENPILYSLLNNLPTKNIVCDSTAEHVRYYQLLVHEQTILAWFPNKIHQT